MASNVKGQGKVQIGVVVGDKMNKTVVVEVKRTVLHPQYKKFVHRHKKFKAHDEVRASHLGDRVEIVESRPLSKTKRWRVRRVIEHAVQ
jgi:small subunit ribosomal protein S17